MSDVRSLIESAQERGLGFSLVDDRVQVRAPRELDGDTKALIAELREIRDEVKAVLAGIEEPQAYGKSQGLTLIVNRTAKVVRPVHLSAWLTIMDVDKFIEATLAGLRSYVAARNRGQEHHWIERLLDEKLERLRVCGVRAEIRQIH